MWEALKLYSSDAEGKEYKVELYIWLPINFDHRELQGN